MAAESALWKLMRGSKLPGHWTRIENRVERGTPDVAFTIPAGRLASDLGTMDGWLELKSVGHLPLDPMHPLHIRHFTQQQRFWLSRRAAAGGKTALMLRVERGPREYILMPGPWASDRLGAATADEIRAAAYGVWGPKWERASFLEALAGMLRLSTF